MNERARFIVLVGGVVVVVAGLWLLLRPANPPEDSTVSPPEPGRVEDHATPSVAVPAARHETQGPHRITGGAVGTRRETLTGEGQIAGAPQSGIGVVKGEVVWADTKAPVEGAEVIAEIQDYNNGEKPPTV